MASASSNGFDKDPERARAAGKKGKRRPYDAIRRARLEQLVEQEIEKKSGGTVSVKMTRDEWYDWALDQIILKREAGAVSAVREQRNRAYGHAPIHLKFEDQTPDAEGKLSLKTLLAIEKLIEKERKRG